MSTSRKWTSLEELLLAISDPLVLETRAIGVNEVGYDNDRPLHVAAIWGDVPAIEMLVAAGADVDAPGEFRFTALYNAVGQGNVAAARRLLELGASPYTRGEWGGTPEELARREGIPQMIALFEEFAGSLARQSGSTAHRSPSSALRRQGSRARASAF